MIPPSHPDAALLRLHAALRQTIVGQETVLDRLLVGLFAGGHILLEGVPGLAKTLMVRSFAQLLGLSHHRIQFTPDLLPADILGTQVFQPRTGEFTIRRGPIFANLILADEVNRAPAKVQSALLEAMQEQTVTLGEDSLALPRPFMVLATQNPIEQEGTFPLPEAQLDRFLMKVVLQYPSRAEELGIVRRHGLKDAVLDQPAVVQEADIRRWQTDSQAVHVEPAIEEYIVDLVRATREPKLYKLPISEDVQFGASPRATLALLRCARAFAFLSGRNYLLPADVKAVAVDVLRHRLVLSYEAEAQERSSSQLIQLILDQLPVP
ncbi:MAG: AAA family ATPase [Gemmataceae bacterium]